MAWKWRSRHLCSSIAFTFSPAFEHVSLASARSHRPCISCRNITDHSRERTSMTVRDIIRMYWPRSFDWHRIGLPWPVMAIGHQFSQGPYPHWYLDNAFHEEAVATDGWSMAFSLCSSSIRRTYKRWQFLVGGEEASFVTYPSASTTHRWPCFSGPLNVGFWSIVSDRQLFSTGLNSDRLPL